jgi:hypothetical protein
MATPDPITGEIPNAITYGWNASIPGDFGDPFFFMQISQLNPIVIIAIIVIIIISYIAFWPIIRSLIR